MSILACGSPAGDEAETARIMMELETRNLERAPAKRRPHGFNRCRKVLKALIRDPTGFARLLREGRSSYSISVAVVVNGGIGDFLRINALLVEFRAQYPDSVFDIFTGNKDRALLTLGSVAGLNRIFEEYLLFWVEGAYDVIYEAHWGMVDARFGPGAPTELALRREQDRHLFALFDEYAGGSACNRMGRQAVQRGYGYMELLAASAGLGAVGPMMPVFDLKATGNLLAGERYVTIHHGWDTRARFGKTPVKCWPLGHWRRFVELFKARKSGVKVVQLGAKTAAAVEGIDVNLINKTSFREACAVLRESLLHVDTDSGFTHVSRVFGTRTIVLFGPTNCEFTAYSENLNIKSTLCGNCAHVTRRWEFPCPRNFESPICMHSIDPEFVVDQAVGFMESGGRPA